MEANVEAPPAAKRTRKTREAAAPSPHHLDVIKAALTCSRFKAISVMPSGDEPALIEDLHRCSNDDEAFAMLTRRLKAVRHALAEGDHLVRRGAPTPRASIVTLRDMCAELAQATDQCLLCAPERICCRCLRACSPGELLRCNVNMYVAHACARPCTTPVASGARARCALHALDGVGASVTGTLAADAALPWGGRVLGASAGSRLRSSRPADVRARRAARQAVGACRSTGIVALRSGLAGECFRSVLLTRRGQGTPRAAGRSCCPRVRSQASVRIGRPRIG